MIVIKIELWPRGNESRAKEIGRMTLTNDAATTLADDSRGSYHVRLMRRGTTDKVQRAGYVENWPRKREPIWKLVHRALDIIYGKRAGAHQESA